MAVHHVAPVGQHLHGDARGGFRPELPFSRAHHGALGRFLLARKLRDRRAVIVGKVVQHAEGDALRGALEGGEDGGGNADVAGHLLQRPAGGMAQAPELASDALRRVAVRRGGFAGRILRLQRLADGGGVEAALGAIPCDALQPRDVLGAVLAMACLRAARHDEALRFPQPQRRGRDAGEPCGLRYLVMNGFVRTHHAKSPILSYRPLIAPLAECAGISKIAVAFLQKKCRNST